MWGAVATIVLAVTSVLLAEAYQVEFFDGKDFDGPFFQSSPTAECVKLYKSGWYRASSLKTGACVLIYENEECEWHLNSSIKVPPGQYPDLAVFHHANLNFDNKIASFQLCADTGSAGGGDVHIADFYSMDMEDPFDIIARYTDFCECVTLPEFAFGHVNRVHNYGNCIRLFSREGCIGDSVDIQGGVSEESNNLDVVNFKGLTKSFSVCGDNTICTRLTAEIFKFELEEMHDTTNSERTVDYIEIDLKSVFRNKVDSTVTKHFVAAKSIQEVLEITRVKALTTMPTVSVSKFLKIQASADFELSARQKLKKALTEAYTFVTNSSTAKPLKFLKEEEVLYSVNENIDIPPCSEYTLTSYIRMIQGYHVNYTMHAIVRGRKGSRCMTAAELKEELIGMDFMEEYNGTGVIAKASGVIKADLGFQTVVDGESLSITGCRD